MTGTVRMILLFGLLVLGLALVALWPDDRAVDPGQPAASREDSRMGRSTLSHGGPGVSGSPSASGRSETSLQTLPLSRSSQATKR